MCPDYIPILPKLDFMKRLLMLFSLLLLTASLVMAQTVQITGTVTSSEDGLPLPGVTIFVKGTTLGALTDIAGKYFLSVQIKNKTLVFSYIGFKSQEIAIEGKTKIDAILAQDLFQVDEVVVVAYGTQQKSFCQTIDFSNLKRKKSSLSLQPTLASILPRLDR